MYENTEFTLSRDCEAIQIPSGQKTTVPAGTQGVITQSLGGSYTIATYQGLARIAEKDLDALEQRRWRHTSGSKNDFDRARLRNGPRHRARCAEQNLVNRWR